MAEDALIVRGAREHNLRNIDVTIPRDQLTVITGLSGSGKSSLAFDTIYAEGQRRYVESLSAYARQFLGLMEKPDVDSIEGLSPAISIEQKTAGHNPRSTVGTVTEIYDYLRLLWARAGTPHCPNCGRPVQRQSPAQIADIVLGWPRDTKIEVRAPLVQGRKGEFRELFETVRKQGFIRAYVDGELIEVADPAEAQSPAESHDLGRRRPTRRARGRSRPPHRFDRDGAQARRRPRRSRATPTTKTSEMFSERYGCPICGISLPELEPRHFSFNSPFGACPTCGGLGTRRRVSEELILGDPQHLDSRGRGAAVGRAERLSAQDRAAGAGASAQVRSQHAVGRSAEVACATACCTATSATGGEEEGATSRVGRRPRQRRAALRGDRSPTRCAWSSRSYMIEVPCSDVRRTSPQAASRSPSRSTGGTSARSSSFR